MAKNEKELEMAMSSYKTTDPNWYSPNIPVADPNITIRFKRTSPSAILPAAQKNGDIGFDLSCAESFLLRHGEHRKISTGIVLADMPTMDLDRNRIFLKIEGRSGLAAKGIFPIGGIIDPNYRGEMAVMLANMGNDMEFVAGSRIAQLVVYKVSTAGEVLIKESDTVTETNRGAAGFGSSGL